MMTVVFRGGRKSPDPNRSRLWLSNHLTTVAPAPQSVDYYSKVVNWPMDLNDQLGDCTCAAVGHTIQALTTYGQGTTLTLPQSAILSLYEAVGGYVPGDSSTDQGANEQDVLNYWLKNGVEGDKILAYAAVDVSNLEEVRTAINIFGHLYIGVNLPSTAMGQFNSNQPWDVMDGASIEGGHAVPVFGYDQNNFQCVTWGRVQPLTLAFWETYTEEAWVVITRDWLNQQGADPQGLNLQALGDEFATLTDSPNPFVNNVQSSLAVPQAGDVGFVSIKGEAGLGIRIGQWLMGDGFVNYEHTFIVTDPLHLVEAEPGGARLAELNEYYGTNVEYFTTSLTQQQRAAVVAKALTELNTPYSFLDYFALAARRLHLPRKLLSKYIASTKHMICSQLVNEVFASCGINFFSDNRIPGDVDPLELRTQLIKLGWTRV